MPRIRFTRFLERQVASPVGQAPGHTVSEALENIFAANAPLRGYLLDDQGALRRHVTVFINGRQIADRTHQSDPVADSDEIFVMQALSGG